MGPLCHTRPQSQHAAMLRHHTRRTLKLVSNSKRLNSDDAFRPEPAMAASFMDIGTRRIFNEDHDSFRDMVRKWFEAEVKPHSMQWEKDGMVSREIWENAGENGLLGIPVSDKYGGVGSDILHAAIMWEEQAYANDAGLGFAMHSDIVMPYIEKWGTEEQKNRLLPAMGQGKLIGALAMTEPGAGSDVQGIKTSAKRDGDDWILNGSKTFITNGQMCDVVLVATVTDPNAKTVAHGTSLFIIEEGMPGFKKGKNLQKLGNKAQDTAELFFEDVRVPSSAILGGEGGVNKGFMMMMNDLPQERLLIGAGCIATCEFLYETTRDYLLDRKAFGAPLAKMQLIRHQMAELKTKIAIGRAFTDQCLELHHQKKLNTSMASMNKYAMSDLEHEVADRCVQLHGGWGYMWEYDVCRAYANARVHRIYGGTNEIMNEIISRDIRK